MPGLLWGTFLGELVPDFYGRHGVVLSAVLVRSDGLTPGPGLYELAKEKGWLRPHESEPAAVDRFQERLFRRFATS